MYRAAAPRAITGYQAGKGEGGRKIEKSWIFWIFSGFRGLEGFQGVPGACGSHSAQISAQMEPHGPVSAKF